jgi:2-hydroxy-6-oxonona-2,4-dienedioate hydrolase/4,5:9,10-diseco-3-hydroxy-5,9,17-trioxoandrosta-1(10),2-diene-4-oate hydrolase
MEVLEGVPRTQSVLKLGHRNLFVTEAGSGYPVVLLHGGGPGATGVSNYSRNIDVLADRFRVIVPDLPGYGQSSKDIDHRDPFGDLAFAIRGLLDELGIEKAHLVGNSYGGAAALRLALDRPDKVDRLILMGPGGVRTTRALPTKGLKSLFGYYGGDGPSRDKLATFIREYLVYDGAAVPDELIDVRYEASIQPEVVADPPLRRPSPAAVRTLLRMDFTRDRRLAHLRTPTLVIWGADDKVNRPAGALSLARTMPNCDLYLAARTGHWVQWERPDLFNSLALDFLGGKAAPR